MRLSRLPLLLTLLMMALAGHSQNVPFQEVVDGTAIPSSFAINELPAEMHAARLTLEKEFNVFSLWLSQAPSGLRNVNGSPGFAQATATFMDCLASNWTKGERKIVDGAEYLITYKMDVPIAVLDSSSAFRGWMELRGFVFKLQLVRASSIIAIEPLTSLTIADVQSAVEAIQSASHMQDQAAYATAAGSAAPGQPGKDTSPFAAEQLGRFIREYAQHYDMKFPSAKTITELQRALRPYMTKDVLWMWNTGNPKKSQYVYNSSLAGLVIAYVTYSWKVPIIYESAPWPDGRRIVVFADGQVKRLTEKEWKEAQKFLKAKVEEK